MRSLPLVVVRVACLATAYRRGPRSAFRLKAHSRPDAPVRLARGGPYNKMNRYGLNADGFRAGQRWAQQLLAFRSGQRLDRVPGGGV